MAKKYTFNEQEEEYDSEVKDMLPVWQSSKYQQSKKKVVEMLDSGKYKGLDETDFWILKGKTSKKDKIAYNGLIISHNGCLKINDSLEDKLKFKPSCVKENKEGYENSLVFTYCNDEQGIYEVGEISSSNYRQSQGRYPYAMAYKRLFDRVVLKNSKLAYADVYSDSEAEEFAERVVQEDKPQKSNEKNKTEVNTSSKTIKNGSMFSDGELDMMQYMDSQNEMINQNQIFEIKTIVEKNPKLLHQFKKTNLNDLTWSEAFTIEKQIRIARKKKEKEMEEVF